MSSHDKNRTHTHFPVVPFSLGSKRTPHTYTSDTHGHQAHLTTVDSKFTQILIQMLRELRTKGHGRFIILPDLPSSDPPHLTGLCFKKSRGLLARVAESNDSERLVFESTRLFSSGEGEKIEECSCSVSRLDSLTVSEDLVENLDRFVETMDKVSNGGFLRGEESELGSDWVEFEWLKVKGYYSIEAFVVNRLEVALRLAWLSNCGGGKKRGVKLKEKLNAAGVAANVYWRKKGCVDWWMELDVALKRKVLVTVLGKSAKSLVSLPCCFNWILLVIMHCSSIPRFGLCMLGHGLVKWAERFMHHGLVIGFIQVGREVA